MLRISLRFLCGGAVAVVATRRYLRSFRLFKTINIWKTLIYETCGPTHTCSICFIDLAILIQDLKPRVFKVKSISRRKR